MGGGTGFPPRIKYRHAFAGMTMLVSGCGGEAEFNGGAEVIEAAA